MTDYLKLLENSYAKAFDFGDARSRLEYLGDFIFDFTTYDDEISELFAEKAVAVCSAINSKTTSVFIKDAGNYRWYLLMCNMPFFVGRLEWGTSIRGARWDCYSKPMRLETCGLWDGDDQITDPIEFTPEKWGAFIDALVKFAKPTQPEAGEP